MKRLLFLALSLLLFVNLTAQSDCYECNENQPWFNLKIVFTGIENDSLNFTVVADQITVNYDAYVIQVSFGVAYTSDVVGIEITSPPAGWPVQEQLNWPEFSWIIQDSLGTFEPDYYQLFYHQTVSQGYPPVQLYPGAVIPIMSGKIVFNGVIPVLEDDVFIIPGSCFRPAPPYFEHLFPGVNNNWGSLPNVWPPITGCYTAKPKEYQDQATLEGIQWNVLGYKYQMQGGQLRQINTLNTN